MGSRNIPLHVMRALWAKSGGRCAICKTEVVMFPKDDDPAIIGEMAHIEGLKPGSPRYNPDMTNSERNSYGNLIVLCPTCHTKIDKDPNFYTVDKLKQIKREHEKWVEERLKISMTKVTFAELDVITKHLISVPLYQPKGALTAVPPKEKMKRNNLSEEVGNLIAMGMLGVNQVRDYLNRNPDPAFAERLREGFVKKYVELRDKGLNGDELFYELLGFASNGSNDFSIRAAGLMVLTYFFEICEVFE
ncbi:ABC-three component system protein [Archaeoglobus veneficus]|uniref:HNH endonuclease n=1 Tax=Archaeoglobus veneficus (strain DSM 11195 / SNP6) TaxID=693661 RepID=F2KSC9_ARCVS|nr:ABC-three component system protein [Archaeoglobus veneficus]AEA46898.1 hypothetical protein Arcve_0884 [Archaeoglobus veneficus SNP6]